MYMILCVVSETALRVNTVLFVVLSYTVQLEVVGETQLHVDCVLLVMKQCFMFILCVLIGHLLNRPPHVWG